jgi:sialate O-acetylesterase
MAVIYDTVDNLGDVHPVRKREVGERLARIALAQDYRQKAVCSGPTFGSVRFAKGIAVVRFDHVDGGLVTNDGKPPTWFEIAGADGKYVTADAVTDGDKVIVSSPGVPAPKAVRLGWSELAQPNLFNGAGLPVRPFRTDSW